MDMHLKVAPSKVQRGAFHQQLGSIQDRVARITPFACAWTTPGCFYAVMRQATIVELALDAETEGFVVQHVGLSGDPWRNNARFTGVPASGGANP
jgi:hypothetical protein